MYIVRAFSRTLYMLLVTDGKGNYFKRGSVLDFWTGGNSYKFAYHFHVLWVNLHVDVKGGVLTSIIAPV